MKRIFWTTSEIAKTFRVSGCTVRRWAIKGIVPSYKFRTDDKVNDYRFNLPQVQYRINQFNK